MARPIGHGPGYEITRQQIIDIAADLFAKKGYTATGVAELGKASGLARGALYYYIGSKEQVLVEIQDRVLTPLLASAHRILRLDEDPLLRLRLMSETLLDVIFKRLSHIWVYEHDYRHLHSHNRARMIGQRREFEQIIEELLIAAMDSGSFRRMDPRLAALQFLNLHNHSYQWLRTEGPWDASFLASEYCRTLFAGFCVAGFDISGIEEQVARFKAEVEGGFPFPPLNPGPQATPQPSLSQQSQ
jgi:TetR/AcrR family transcriptional regulator, cholesterol catabolism regulator